MASAARAVSGWLRPCEGRSQDAELSHPEPARPQDVVVELRDGTVTIERATEHVKAARATSIDHSSRVRS